MLVLVLLQAEGTKLLLQPEYVALHTAMWARCKRALWKASRAASDAAAEARAAATALAEYDEQPSWVTGESEALQGEWELRSGELESVGRTCCENLNVWKVGTVYLPASYLPSSLTFPPPLAPPHHAPVTPSSRAVLQAASCSPTSWRP